MSNYSLAELGEISKARVRLVRAPKRHPRMAPRNDTRHPAQVKADVQQLRDEVRASNASRGVGHQYNNYGVPHKPHLDTTGVATVLPYSTRRGIAEGVSSAGGKVGEAVGGGASRALEAGGAQLGREAGKSGEEIARQARKSANRVGVSLLGAGAIGGTSFGAVAGIRRRRSKKENVKLDRTTGRLIIA